MNTTLHIYTRVSTLIQQEEGASLETQKQLGIRKAKELGVDYQLWNEGGQSSAHDDLNNRPVLVSLLSLIESGSVKRLFVYNTDRLSRNQQTWAVIRYKLLAHGVTLHTASGQMTLKNPVDDLMLGILSEISQYDNRIRAERSRLGKFHKIQQGSWKGGPPPYGFRLDKRRLEVDPFESEWVRKIFSWYCEGVAVKAIQARLAQAGVITRRGNSNWSLRSLDLILRNSVYVGYYDYTDNMLGETVRVQAPPIIDSQTYEAAQNRKRLSRERQLPTVERKHFYLLRDLLVCGHCGVRMGGRTNKGGHQNLYYCVSRERSWKTRSPDHPKWRRDLGCSMKRSINIGRTDEAVVELIKSVLRELEDRRSSEMLNDVQRQSVHHDLSDSPSAEIVWTTAAQFELLSGVEKRDVLQKLIRKIDVFFDPASGKHRLEVELSDVVRQQLGEVGEVLGDHGEGVRSDHELLEAIGGDAAGKKLWGSRVTFAA